MGNTYTSQKTFETCADVKDLLRRTLLHFNFKNLNFPDHKVRPSNN
jgi:hypothetical protein